MVEVISSRKWKLSVD